MLFSVSYSKVCPPIPDFYVEAGTEEDAYKKVEKITASSLKPELAKQVQMR